MRRDDDLIRALLLEMEKSDDPLFDSSQHDEAHPDNDRRHYHFELMGDAGLVTEVQTGFYRLTSRGHDYLDSIRDEGIWKQTKAAVAETGGSATLDILKTLAAGFLKKRISQLTGIEL